MSPEESVAQTLDAGWDGVPVGEGSKVSLTRWNVRNFTREALLYHVRRGGNFAVRAGATPGGVKVLAVDRDNRREDTWRFLQEHRLTRSNMQVETASSNWHLWFRVPDGVEELTTKIRLMAGNIKLPVDAKVSGYVLFPPSRIGAGEYRFREGKGLKRPEDLEPVSESFLELLRREAKPAPPIQAGVRTVRARATRIVCPERYVLAIPSVMGSNGSAGLVKAVCVLRDAGWSGSRIYEFLINVWNPACAIPEWPREAIARAVNRHTGGKG